MANAASKVRDVFKAAQCELTLAEIREAMPELKSNEVSMALCYFRKQRYVTRRQIDNKSSKGRKAVWLYTYHDARLPKPEPVAE
jgi:predicted transcriptional regulator